MEVQDQIFYKQLNRKNRNYFSACSLKDGGLDIFWNNGKQRILDAKLDWVQNANRTWEAQAYDPVGQTLLLIKWQKEHNRLNIRGFLKEKMPYLEVAPDHSIKAGGLYVGFKADEVPCLFQARFPKSWLSKMYRNSNNLNSSVTILEEDRIITINFSEIEAGGDACAHFSWSNFWGLKKSQVTWCINSKRKGRLLLPANEFIEWMQSDA